MTDNKPYIIKVIEADKVKQLREKVELKNLNEAIFALNLMYQEGVKDLEQKDRFGFDYIKYYQAYKGLQDLIERHFAGEE